MRTRWIQRATVTLTLGLVSPGCHWVFSEGTATSVDAAIDGKVAVDASCAGNDMDCDGVTDGNDSCPTLANPLQLDEDTDRLGDVCDDCVGIGPSESSDNDSDGIGDRCDPALGKQRVVAKYFVEGGNSFTNATAEGTGTWKLTATEATSTTFIPGEQRVLLGAPINDSQIYLEAGLRNVVTSTPGTVVGFLVAVGTTRIHLLYSANSNRLVIRRNDPSTLFAEPLLQPPASNFILRGEVTRVNPTRYAVAVRIDGGNVRASFEVDTDAATPRIGLIADTKAEVGYLAVYANP